MYIHNREVDSAFTSNDYLLKRGIIILITIIIIIIIKMITLFKSQLTVTYTLPTFYITVSD